MMMIMIITGESPIPHVESLPLSQGADMSLSLAASIRYHPGLPTSYMPPPPPGTTFTPTEPPTVFKRHLILPYC